MNFLIKNVVQYRHAIGFSLIILGVQLGNFIRVLLGFELVNIIMMMGLLFICDFNNLRRLKFPLLYGKMKLLLLSQIIILFYAAFGNNANSLMQPVFLIYSFFLVIIICTNKKMFEGLIPVFFVFSSLTSIFALAVITNNFSGILMGEDLYSYRMEIENDGNSMMFLYGESAMLNIGSIMMMSHSYKFRFNHIILIILMCIDVFLLINGGKRTVTVMSIMIIIYYFWNKGYVNSIFSIIKITILLIITIPLFALLIDAVTGLHILELIGAMFDNMVNGLNTFFQIGNAYEESADTRVQLRKMALNIMNNDFSWYNYILGNGYMWYYLDQPILQSYFDMGFFSFIVYYIPILVMPLTILKSRNNNEELLLFKLFAWINICLCLTGGLPYGYKVYMYSFFLIFGYNLYKRNQYYANGNKICKYKI